MKFIADLHIHSKFSRATSKQSEIPTLYKFAKLKGLDVLATGDFTHPGYYKELEQYLEEDGHGLLNIKEEYKNEINKEMPHLKDKNMKFIFSVEISSIYKKKDKVRKIHNVILLPDFKSVKKFNEKLGAIGNIRSDGRPILGLDSKNLLEIALEINPDTIFIPAHIWTPWFSLFGMNSGFDTIEECFEDLTKEIFALETGLSSDPPMNWRISALDKYNLISNSDAHSPEKLGREANLFNTELSYDNIRNALKNKNSNEFLGTIEFFPEEGKYHFDGHRNCNQRLTPKEALANKLICPVCGKKITVGVLHRVEVLADRKDGHRPDTAKDFHSVIPLNEIIADAFAMTTVSQKVKHLYNKMIYTIGPELFILNEAPLEDIKKNSTAIIAEGIKRVREKKVTILPGYDGEYGKIIIFSEEDRLKNASQSLLINISPAQKQVPKTKPQTHKSQPVQTIKIEKNKQQLENNDIMNKQQLKALNQKTGPVIVIAGPGTGKTYTLISKITALIKDNTYQPESILAITFTNKAAKEIKERLQKNGIENLKTSTFHGLALEILRENNFSREIFDDFDSRKILQETLQELNLKKNIHETLNLIMRYKANADEIKDPELKNISEIYQAKLDYYQGMDFTDIIIYCYKLLKKYPEMLAKIKNKYQYILVDEFQDVNYYEYNLIKLLSDQGKNLFVIGDPDQSIYKFRGSSPDFIFKLTGDFPCAQTIQLKNNYRNPECIIHAGIDVISPGSRILKKYTDVQVLIKSSSKIDMIIAASELSAGIQIAKIITNQVGGSAMHQADMIDSDADFTFKDFVILVRNSSQIPVLEEVLLHEGIPYKIIGDRSLFDQKAIRLAVNILKLSIAEFNNFRFFQVIESDYFNIPDNIISALRERIHNPEINLIEELYKIEPKLNNTNLALLKKLLNEKNSKYDKPENLLKKYPFTFFNKENLQQFMAIARKYDTIENFLNTIQLGKDQDLEVNKENLNKIKNIERVSIQTLHSAKGMEFPVVFIFEAIENLMPYLEKDSDLDEERRLFYVGMTRAKEKLFFVIPERKKQYGRSINTEISRFIDDIQDNWLEIKEVQINEKNLKDKSQLTLW